MTYRRDNTELVPRRTPRRSSSQLMTSQWKPTTTTKSTLLTVYLYLVSLIPGGV